jgi:hypothetical protein
LLAAHGLASIEERGWLFPNGDMPGLRAVWNPKSATGRDGGRLDVHAFLGADLLIEECFAGSGGQDSADSDLSGRVFRFQSGHLFRSVSGHLFRSRSGHP